jgi:hypothetical protein
VNYQPPWLVTTLGILRKLPVVKRLPAALDWRDKKITALEEAIRRLEDEVRRKDEELRLKDSELFAKQAELQVKEDVLHTKENELRAKEALPGSAELEIYRLRSRLNRSVARAEQERLHRLEMEDTVSSAP